MRWGNVQYFVNSCRLLDTVLSCSCRPQLKPFSHSFHWPIKSFRDNNNTQTCHPDYHIWGCQTHPELQVTTQLDTGRITDGQQSQRSSRTDIQRSKLLAIRSSNCRPVTLTKCNMPSTRSNIKGDAIHVANISTSVLCTSCGFRPITQERKTVDFVECSSFLWQVQLATLFFRSTLGQVRRPRQTLTQNRF